MINQISIELIPPLVLKTAETLLHSGFKTYLAGGCVRDLILNRKPKDWDFVTNASVEEIRKLFPNTLEVGVAFGILKLKKTSENDPEIDIAIFRKEEAYEDFRHPSKVEIGDEESDTARRDFTINALYFDLKTKTIIDTIDGQKDIAAKTIRTVGSATKRFSEDALRILRAIRFAAQLGFKIEAETLTVIKKYSKLMKAISRERIREELFKILESPKPLVGLELLIKTGMWFEIFGTKKSALPADYRSLKFNEKPSALGWICALGVTGLLGDVIQKPEEMVERVTERLRLSNEEKKIFCYLIFSFETSKTSIDLKSKESALDWIKLAKSEKALIEFCKRFIRRARGVEAKEKELTIELLDRAIRFASNSDYEKKFPSAAALIKEGFSEGPKLGNELKKRQWMVFWDLK